MILGFPNHKQVVFWIRAMCQGCVGVLLDNTDMVEETEKTMAPSKYANVSRMYITLAQMVWNPLLPRIQVSS